MEYAARLGYVARDGHQGFDPPTARYPMVGPGGLAMREATEREFSAVRSQRFVDVRYMFGTRYSTVELTFCGKPVGSQTTLLKRGKPVSVQCSVDSEWYAMYVEADHLRVDA